MRFLLVLLAAFAAWLPATSAFAAEGDGKARTDALIAAFKKVKADAGAAANAKVYDELDGFLDFDTLISGTIEGRADKFTPAQRKEFEATFRELIRQIAYANSGGFFAEAELKFLPETKQGDVTVTQIETRLPSEDLETEVGLHWKSTNGALRIVDVSFDGDSLVLDYRNQFAGIIEKEGAAGLVAKAKDRLAELQKPKKKE